MFSFSAVSGLYISLTRGRADALWPFAGKKTVVGSLGDGSRNLCVCTKLSLLIPNHTLSLVQRLRALSMLLSGSAVS